MANGITLFNHYLARIAGLEDGLRLANEATLLLVERAAAAVREVERYKGLLDEAKGYIAALEHQMGVE